MTHLLWLSDDAWAAIEPHLPRGKPGKPRVDDRRVISGSGAASSLLLFMRRNAPRAFTVRGLARKNCRPVP